MRKHSSVCMLLLRGVIWKELGILAGMAAVEGFLFYRVFQRARVAGSMSLELLVEQSNITWIFALASLLLTVFLCRNNCNYGSRQGYTLWRLSITEKQVFLWQWACAAACYLLLWAVQVLTAVLLGICYMKYADPAITGSQTLFLAFYRNDFLHSLLPLEFIGGWIGNFCLAAGLGIAAAHFSYRQRRGKQGLEIIALYCTGLVFFLHALGNFVYVMFTILLSLIVIAAVLFRVLGGEADEDEN